MKQLVTATVLSLVVTFTAAMALTAPDATLAVLAVAAATALVAWVASWSSTEDHSGLALTGPGAALGLTLVGRSPLAGLLPLVAAQVVGAVAGGLAALALDGASDATLVWDAPGLLPAGVLALVVGLLTTWAVLAADGEQHVAWPAVPAVVSGAVLGPALAAAGHPAAVLGLAVAGVLDWPLALLVAGAALLGAALGAFSIAVVTPAVE